MPGESAAKIDENEKAEERIHKNIPEEETKCPTELAKHGARLMTILE